jgi:hypothetical protein
VARAHEFFQVEVPGVARHDGLLRMQLRQFPPDVVRDVVVRFVKSVPDEVFYAHYGLTQSNLMEWFLERRTSALLLAHAKRKQIFTT